jgi:hypothetical protein
VAGGADDRESSRADHGVDAIAAVDDRGHEIVSCEAGLGVQGQHALRAPSPAGDVASNVARRVAKRTPAALYGGDERAKFIAGAAARTLLGERACGPNASLSLPSAP